MHTTTEIHHSLLKILRLPTMWQYDLDLWPPTLKNNRHFPFIMLNNWTKLCDPGAYESFWILPATVFTMWQYNLDLSSTTLKNYRHIPFRHADQLYKGCKIVELKVQSVFYLQCILPHFPCMSQYDLDLLPQILKNNRHLSLIMLIKCKKL